MAILVTTVVFCLLLVSTDGRPCSFNSMCSCRSGDGKQDTEISCVGVPFSKLPDLPHGNTSNIGMIGAGLEVLAGDSFGDMKTVFLNLMSNRIISVHDHTFTAMYKTLEKLDLSFNSLQSIPIESFTTLRKLKVLNLQRNEISSMKVAWDYLRETLSSLYLNGNDLYILPSDPDYSLSNFKALVQIYLDGNYLAHIESNALPFSLQVLSVSENLLPEIPVELIDILKDLSRMYMKNNYIGAIPSTRLKQKKSLMEIDLSYNLIKSVDSVFDNSIQIKVLNLQSNYIDSVSPLAFNGLASNKLDLSNNELSSLPERAFVGLEYSLEHLDLSHNKLPKIPKAILSLKHLKYLALDYNDLPGSYPDNFLKNCSQAVRSLSLRGNAIATFPKNIFKQAKKMSFLDLGYNQIESIDENDFVKWGENLETLVLTQNSITRLQTGTFKHLKKLVELNLSFNIINKIDDKAFTNIGDQIKTLDMSYGLRTNEFPDVALKPLSSLIYLALSGNNITTLIKTGIYDLPNLQYFILDFNQVSEVPENFFHSKVHKSLKDIRLSYNKLFKIDINTFNGLEELNYIVLNDNKISSINGGFRNLPSMLTVILSNNQIDKILPMSFVNVPNFVSLDLNNNYLSEFSFNVFQNVTNELQPMSLNLSKNRIENIYASDTMSQIHLKSLDLSHNKLSQVPQNLMLMPKESLRKLDLGYNQIRLIESNEFYNFKGLETLNLCNNGLITLRGNSFHGLNRLQILDLSHNHLELLHLGQFKNLENLRILDLSHNHLRSLPNSAFHNTKLERLIVNNNVFVLLPTTPFVDVGYTLRVIDFSQNQIEQIGREVFASMPLISEVNLCNNRLVHVHNHDFKGVNPLIRLELCGNKLSHVNRELLHYTPNLRYLSLAETHLKEVPLLDVPNLVWLNLSHNYIEQLPGRFLEGLHHLRHLDLSYNNLTVLSGISWSLAPYMKTLDLSNNPIKIFTRDSFTGLLNLNHLDIQNLHHLERFDSDTLAKCKLLRSLKIQTWPKIEKYRFQLPRIITNLKQLKKLSVMIIEEKLTDQLHRSYPKKLQFLEVTGKNLRELGENSLEGLEVFKEFHLKISGTSIKSFPKRIFWKIRNNKFTLDLSDNLIEDTDPEVFYEKGSLRKHGTQRSYAGNINLQNNPIVCGCNTMWYSKWLKRYLIETHKININKPEFNQHLKQEIKSSACYSKSDDKPKALLTFEDSSLACRDVLSSDAPSAVWRSSAAIWSVVLSILLRSLLYYC